MKKDRLQAMTRWAFAGLSFVFFLAALLGLADSWSQVVAIFSSGEWNKNAYIFVVLFFASIGISAWCLELSGFNFEKLADGASIVAVAGLMVFAFTLLIGKPPASQEFLPFVLVLAVLMAAHVWLQKAVSNVSWAIVLTLLFPLFSLAGLVVLYRYVFAQGSPWADAVSNGWIIAGYGVLVLLPVLLLIPYRKYFGTDDK